jgi:predicted dehydrogenase
MAEQMQWGILSTGAIARAFAQSIPHSETGALLAVASRTQEAADCFGAEFNIPRCYGSYEALLADPDVQAVYLATPHPMHAEWVVKAAEAGKHILCEKPFTLNAAEAACALDAVRRHDVFLMEAFMYRAHPQTARLVELIRQGAVGAVRVIQATFSFHGEFRPEWRLFKHELGGGGILDVGCYCASMVRLLAGAALGQPFAEPLSVKAFGHLGETRVDEYAVAIAQFPGDVLAQLSCGGRLHQENIVRVYGDEGYLVVPTPWVPIPQGGVASIVVYRHGEEAREIHIETGQWIYAIEMDHVAAHLAARQAPAMPWDDTLGNMRMLDRWRAEIGMVYDMEV